MPNRLSIKESELNELYTEQGMSLRQIAERHGVHYRTIGKLMARLGIAARQQKTG